MNSTAYPYPLKRIQLGNDIDLAYIDQGQGDHTLLFIHGLGSYMPAWNKNIAELRKDFRCLALDLPNYGQSKRGKYSFSMPFFAKTVDAFIRKLQLQNVVLVGHSMGGQIALTMALDLNTEIKKLVLIAPAGFEVFNEAEIQWLKQVYTPALLKAATPEQIRQNFNLNFASNMLPKDAQFMYEDRIQMQQDPAYYDSYCRMIPDCVSSMLEYPVFHRLQQINIPTLILFGQEDLLIPNRILHPMETAVSIAKTGHGQLPESELVLISPGGHFVQWECAGIVNERIRNFRIKTKKV